MFLCRKTENVYTDGDVTKLTYRSPTNQRKSNKIIESNENKCVIACTIIIKFIFVTSVCFLLLWFYLADIPKSI